MLVGYTLALLGFVVGAALHIYLAALFAQKRGRGRADSLLLALTACAALWYAGNAIAFFYRINTGQSTSPFIAALENLTLAGMVAIPPLLLHLGLMLAERPARWAWLGYLAAPLGWWFVRQQQPAGFQLLLAVGLAALALLCLWAAARAGDATARRFLRGLALALAIALAGLAAGPGSAPMVWASLAPPLYLTFFISIRPSRNPAASPHHSQWRIESAAFPGSAAVIRARPAPV
jgi:hypothetical protein